MFFRYFTSIAFVFLFCKTLIAQLPPDFYDTKITDGLQLPLGITFDGNGQGYVWEQSGIIHVLDENDQLLPTPLLDIHEEVMAWKDHGLNGFCLDNDFLDNGYIYLYYVVDMHHYRHFGTPQYHPDSTAENQPSFGRITRYQADAATGFTSIVPGSRTVLLGETLDKGVPILYEFHGLGTILQGTDGSLLFSCGEGVGGLWIGIGNEPGDEFMPLALEWGIVTPDEDIGSYRAQYMGSMNGKVLRIDPDTGDGLPGNPFYQEQSPRSAQSRTWAYGFRNPYRMMLWPNTGSHFITEGSPGTLLIGDVGNGSWEELNICQSGGQNFGWPILEGVELAWKYWIQDVPDNPMAPNPVSGCDRPYFSFRDLMALPNVAGPYLPANPCDPSQSIPSEYFPSYPQLPVLFWSNTQWNTPTRAAVPGWKENGDPDKLILGTPDSPVLGESFDGFSSLSGVVYEGDQFPEAYRGKYFHIDYSGWIKVLEFDDNLNLVSVMPFHDDARDIIHIALHPQNGALYYSNVRGDIRKITYGGNPAPVPVIVADRYYGVSPLTVQFSAMDSYDPDQDELSYFWDFGDGSTSIEPTPTHLFTTTGAAPASFTVKLTVTDADGAAQTAERIVSLNNTPPAVDITSFEQGDLYPLGATSLLRLAADVHDAEHPNESLQYVWRTYLHHNLHFHPDPPIYDPESFFLIAPLGCGDEEYHYRIELTVTDPEGLSTTLSQRIYPDCDAPFVEWIALEGQPVESNIVLEWGTDFTNEVAKIELHRGTDYYHFQKVAEVLPRPDGQYTFTDDSPQLGSNFYRVKAVATNGAFSYSNLLQITYPQPSDWKVFPNPSNRQFNFYIKEASDPVVSVEVFNMMGQQLHTFRFEATPGQEWGREVLLDYLPAGVYSYRITNGDNEYVGQVVLQ
ncbi:MAG: PQQ-dependent sugar dehydrogenase [Saprospiraceae bacterium]